MAFSFIIQNLAEKAALHFLFIMLDSMKEATHDFQRRTP